MMQYLPEHGRKRPKCVGFLNGCIIVISCSTIAGMYTVLLHGTLIIRNMNSVQLNKYCQCRILGILEIPLRAVGLRSTVWGSSLFSHAPYNDVSVNADRIYDGGPIRLYYNIYYII
jgi:hypothetical protein